MKVSPALPPRRPSGHNVVERRNSNSSDVSYMSTLSASSLGQPASSRTSASSDHAPTRRLPPTLDMAKLPALPPTKREREAKEKAEAEARAKEEARAREEAEAQAARIQLQATRSAPEVPRVTEPSRPSLPPRVPTLPVRPARPTAMDSDEQAPALPARRLPLPPRPTPTPRDRQEGVPPPVPVSSRPTFAQIDAACRATGGAAVTGQSASIPAGDSCLVCRDYSAPDAVAAQYPRESLPRQDPVSYLAHVLCDPFPSATDKARAIFTWFHHNMAYDTHGFFNKCIPRGLSAAEQIFSGKAVCQGYADTYEAIARRAGLECIVISGHGKGFGFADVKPGQPIPDFESTHAWNAVRIDGGEWKLIDVCWGAGHIGADREYNKKFKPKMFWLENKLFGLKHFPSNPNHFFRDDGRIPTWEEYVVGPFKGEQAHWQGDGEGFSEYTFSPRPKHIPVNSGEVVRFQFGKICPHWDGEKHGKGKPLLLMMRIRGPNGRGFSNGRKDDLVTLETNGSWWWVDIPARDLGAPGEKLECMALTTLDNKDARGVTAEHFATRKGRAAMSWSYIALWELV